MALLASYMVQGEDGETLERLPCRHEIFAGVPQHDARIPTPADAAGFRTATLTSYRRPASAAEKAAVSSICKECT